MIQFTCFLRLLWLNLVSHTAGAILGTPNAATVTIVDNDSSPATSNPIDGTTLFITQQYIDFLGRLPDSIGLANWTDTLGNCPNGGFGEFDNPGCIGCTFHQGSSFRKSFVGVVTLLTSSTKSDSTGGRCMRSLCLTWRRWVDRSRRSQK